jgi:hypothetical protein
LTRRPLEPVEECKSQSHCAVAAEQLRHAMLYGELIRFIPDLYRISPHLCSFRCPSAATQPCRSCNVGHGILESVGPWLSPLVLFKLLVFYSLTPAASVPPSTACKRPLRSPESRVWDDTFILISRHGEIASCQAAASGPLPEDAFQKSGRVREEYIRAVRNGTVRILPIPKTTNS